MSTAPPDGKRNLLFYGVALLIPLIFFVLLEGGLRLFGYGATYPLFEVIEDAPRYMQQSNEVAHRYFANTARVPTGLADPFRAEKLPKTYRIFVQGGSSAAGYPYYYGGSFSRMLEQRLQQTFPDREIEVVNTALAAVNSYTLLDFADEIIAQQPDAVLIYAGHNEYYGALGVGSSESLGPMRGLINLYLGLRDVRTMQLLRAGLARIAQAAASLTTQDPGAALMERMVGEQHIPLDSPLYQAGLDQFQGNITRLLVKYQQAGIPVFIGTVASNEVDQPPFISAPADPARTESLQTLLDRAEAEQTRNNLGAAQATLREAIELAPNAAQPYFQMGQILLSLDRPEEARSYFIDAKERDQLRFRAPEAINEIIREVAATYDAVVVESQAAFVEASPHGAIGFGLMLEHLHPNIDGYFLIADAFYKAMQTEGVIGEWTHAVPTDVATRERLLTPIDSLMADFRVQVLMGSWPFQPIGSTFDPMAEFTPSDTLEMLAATLYRRERSWYATMNAQRTYFEQKEAFGEALRVSLAQIQQFPYAPAAYAEAAGNLARMGRATEAMQYFGAATDIEESYVVYKSMGRLSIAMRKLDDAERYFRRGLQLMPSDLELQFWLAYALANQEEFDEARVLLEQIVQRQPQYPNAAALLARIVAASSN